MSVHTLLMDFFVDSTLVKNENQVASIFTKIENILRDYLTNFKSVSTFHADGDFVKIYFSDLGTMTTMRIYSHGFLTINIEFFSPEGTAPALAFDVRLSIL